PSGGPKPIEGVEDLVPERGERVARRRRRRVVAGRAGAVKVDLLADEVLLAHGSIVPVVRWTKRGPRLRGALASGAIVFRSGVRAEAGLRARDLEVLVDLHRHDAAVGLAHMRLVRRPRRVRLDPDDRAAGHR